MKRILISTILFVFIVISFSVLALAAEMEPKSIDTVLSEIRQEQGISSTDTIDVDKVSDAKLEELGDSVMEVMISNSVLHEQMNARLDGWILMLLGGLIVIGITVLIIFALIHATNVSGKSSTSAPHEVLESNSRALAILSERYARGEISDEEYKQKKIEITKP